MLTLIIVVVEPSLTLILLTHQLVPGEIFAKKKSRFFFPRKFPLGRRWFAAVFQPVLSLLRGRTSVTESWGRGRGDFVVSRNRHCRALINAGERVIWFRKHLTALWQHVYLSQAKASTFLPTNSLLMNIGNTISDYCISTTRNTIILTKFVLFIKCSVH